MHLNFHTYVRNCVSTVDITFTYSPLMAQAYDGFPRLFVEDTS